jgi:hypothetical protein
MNYKIFLKRSFFIVIIIASIFLLTGWLHTTSAEIINLEYSFTEPEISEIIINNTIQHKITMNDSQILNIKDLPMLPMKSVKILLPQNETLESLKVNYSGNTSMGSGYNVTLGLQSISNFSEQQNDTNVSYYKQELHNHGNNRCQNH